MAAARNLTDRLGPKSSEIAAKVIDGEAIIINLTNGYYYSMDGPGAVVWESLQAGCSLEQIVGALCGRYDVTFDTAVSDVQALLEQLLQEELVALQHGEPPPRVEPSSVESKLPYREPTLEKYGDMAHFFAMDPPLPELEEAAGGTQPAE